MAVMQDPALVVLQGRAQYKGTVYLVRWHGDTPKGYRCHLTTADQACDFWVACNKPGEKPVPGKATVFSRYRLPHGVMTLARLQLLGANQDDEEDLDGL